MMAKIFKAGILNKNQELGFTLFELIVVIAIIGILMGFTIPNITFADPQQELNTATRRLSGAVSEARSRAVLKRVTLELHLDRKELRIVQRTGNKQLEKAALPETVTISQVIVDEKEQRTLLVTPKGITQPATVKISSPPYTRTLFIKPIQGISYQK